MVETLLVVAGRRSGKTKAMAVLSIYLATLCDWSGDLSLGERGLSLFMAPTERQAGVAHRYAEAIVDHVPLLHGLIENRTANSLALKRSIDLETQPASWRFSRGFTSVSVTLDECAFFYCSDEHITGLNARDPLKKFTAKTSAGDMRLRPARNC